MIIDQLISVLKPPTPSTIPGRDWRTVEAHVGAILPADYKEFIHAYGAGCIGDFLWVYSPFATKTSLNLLQQAAAVVNSLATLGAKWPNVVPFELFPQDGGIYPWGCTDNGDHLFWHLRQGEFVHPIVVGESRASAWVEYDMPTVDFVFGLITKRISTSIFPSNWPNDRPSFVPAV